MIIVDPDSTQALPSGLMRVRIKLYTQESSYEQTVRMKWPSALPERPMILVPLDASPKVLKLLRIVELANSIRVIPGQSIGNFGTTKERTAIRGVHGLNMCIHIDSSYRRSEVTACLEPFRVFRGRLNELSIIGSPNEQQARAIGASIFASCDPELGTTFPELLIHVFRLMALANLRVQKHAATVVFEQTRAMVHNSHAYDNTPYTGWANNADAHESLLEILIINLPGYIGCCTTSSATVLSVLRTHSTPSVTTCAH
jgi:hypothetical protein